MGLSNLSPPRLFATPFQFKSPPAKKNKNGEGAKGEGGTPRLCEALGGMVRVTTQSERMMKSKATTRAERAISRQSDYCENMFELFLTNTAKFQNSFFRQNVERRKATRQGFPRELPKGF